MRGSIPPISLRPLWFVNGVCKGMRMLGHDEDEFDLMGNHTDYDYLDPLRPIVQHLRAYAGEVVSTEGIEWLLMEGRVTREVSYDVFQVEDDTWVNEAEACRIADRKSRTINEWRRRGWVKSNSVDDAETLYLASDLRMLKENMGKGRVCKVRT